MGNVYTGLDLIRKLGEGGLPSAYGLTFPLLTKADGTKMGKSAAGAVWLSPGLPPASVTPSPCLSFPAILVCPLPLTHPHPPFLFPRFQSALVSRSMFLMLL